MANFIDFGGQIGDIRVSLAEETEKLFKETQNVTLDCNGELNISTLDGVRRVASIHFEGGGIYMSTTSDVEYDLMDLETDDMVAVYEHVWYVFKEK